MTLSALLMVHLLLPTASPTIITEVVVRNSLSQTYSETTKGEDDTPIRGGDEDTRGK